MYSWDYHPLSGPFWLLLLWHLSQLWLLLFIKEVSWPFPPPLYIYNSLLLLLDQKQDLSLTFSTIQYKVGKVGDLVSQDKDQVGQGQGQELDNLRLSLKTSFPISVPTLSCCDIDLQSVDNYLLQASKQSKYEDILHYGPAFLIHHHFCSTFLP